MGLITAGVFFIFILMLLISYVWIVRPYDRLLGSKGHFLEHGVIGISIIIRATNYCRRIRKPLVGNWYDENTYGDFNFRDHATTAQRRISLIFNLCMNGFLFCLFLYVMLEMIF